MMNNIVKNRVCSRFFTRNMSTKNETSLIKKAKPIYMDYQATTPMDPRVLDKMLPLYAERFGNPHSRSHIFGWETEKMIEDARMDVGALINANPKCIIFTSGATESNNMAIKGTAGFYINEKNEKNERKYNHIITTQIEHKCILASCRRLQTNNEKWDVTYLPTNKEGLIDLNELKSSIRDDTLLVSIMHVNNEIGVIQPIKVIGEICKEKNVLFHTDAAQSIGKIPIDVDEMNIDLLSISGHKLYGPKGCGAIYVRNKPKRVRLLPLIDGGGQERGFRAGTLPAPIIVGLGEACKIAKKELVSDNIHIKALYDQLLSGIKENISDVTLNGSEKNRYFGNLNISFECVEGESLIMRLNTIALSSGSACTSQSLEPSYVLRAIGVNEELAHTSLRFGIGRFTTEKEIQKCIEQVIHHIHQLRNLSPLWEIKQEKLTGNYDEEQQTTMKWT